MNFAIKQDADQEFARQYRLTLYRDTTEMYQK